MKIYMLIKNNIPVYIGLTKQRWLSNRISAHRYNNKSGFRKYKDFDSYELIEETDDPSRESYWIKYYDTFNNGYNETKHGVGINYPRRVHVFNNDGFNKIYDSMDEACIELNLDNSNLSKVCRHKYKRKIIKGFKAEFIE